jgi:hypothetical protein
MKFKIRLFILALPLFMAFNADLSAVSPQAINYQGRLTDASGDPVADGNYLIKFKIYGSAAGNDSLWWSGFQTIAVANGLFSYQLTVPSWPNGIFAYDTTRYLGITVGIDPEISPRSRFISNAYSYSAVHADTAVIALTANNVANGSIVNVDINAAAGISASKISGTAATLNAYQTFTANNTFMGALAIFDSVFYADNNGIRIGDPDLPTTGSLIRAERNYYTLDARYGLESRLYNGNSGLLYGIYSKLDRGASAGGNVYGVYSDVDCDGAGRYGILSSGSTTTNGIGTGTSYGIYTEAMEGTTAFGIYARALSANTNWAGYFAGNVNVTGTLSKGGGAFRIDHPLDPENKYLQHSFVESPDMMNIYNGNVITDADGNATINMPDYFGTLNMDFRYQLTVIGQFAQAIVAEEISENKFSIQTDKPNVKVSWQVTGVRKDKWAEQNRIQVEVDKRPEEVGKYAHPEAYNLPIERSIDYENIRQSHEREQHENTVETE